VLRRRDGRRPPERAARPIAVSLEALVERDPAAGGGLLLDDPLETMAAESLSDEVRAAVRRALRRLPAEQARILQWRFRDNLDREAIMQIHLHYVTR